jgi:bifunctional UDP-N-acetylglucosamine pyrophosphorylase / glucosamine-1-phosphate N-acetyltransferase
MTENLLAVVFASARGREGKPGRSEHLHPWLKKSSVQLISDTVARLRPQKFCAIPADAKEEICALREILARCKRKNVLILQTRYPLLNAGSFRSLLHLHQRDNNALTRMSAGAGDKEVDLGVYVSRTRDLLDILDKIGSRRISLPGSREIVHAMIKRQKKVGVYRCPRTEETLAVETARDAARAVRILRDRKMRALEAKGVIVIDPVSTWVDLDVCIGRGTVLYPSVVIEGKSRLGKECRVYPFVHLINTCIGDKVKILSSTMIEESTIEDEAQVGPFTHFRPKTVLRPKAKVGNFVEMKNTVFGKGSKAGHLSYLGDSIVEDGVNIGAGTITCNYDGLKKYQTIIEQGAFIGSGTELVAPVKVGRGSYIGAGSTITKDVSPDSLAVARSHQIEKPGWARKRKKE